MKSVDLNSNVKTRKVVVSATNANGEPDFFFVKVTCTDEQYENGDHHDAAKDAADPEGYYAFLPYDEASPPGAAFMSLFAWETASIVDISSRKPAWVDSHSVNCHGCGKEVDERECTKDTEGFDICPACSQGLDKAGVAECAVATITLITADNKRVVVSYIDNEGKIKQVNHEVPAGEPDSETVSATFRYGVVEVIVNGDTWRELESAGIDGTIIKLLFSGADETEISEVIRKLVSTELSEKTSIPGYTVRDFYTIEEVAKAMKETGPKYPPTLWYDIPEINDAINYGVKMGWLYRCSVTQVEWTEKGVKVFKAEKCTCNLDHTEKNSVVREYINKDGQDSSSSVFCRGHYTEAGDFEPDETIDLSHGRFDLADNSDVCDWCGGLI